MRAAGYVLVGGRSSRMGVDKALIPHADGTLADHAALAVLAACGNVTLVGDPARYGHLGYPVIADKIAGNGPLGGVVAALSASLDDWNLIVACDMPNIDAGFLRNLIDEAERATGAADCVVPETAGGPQPLCALYHRRALPLLDSFLNHKFLRMRETVKTLNSVFVPFAEDHWFQNLNTPEDLKAHG
jgi:molybdopterin-guanine dinucleotide biosynthesis protein A